MKKIVFLNIGFIGLSDRTLAGFAGRISTRLNPEESTGLVDVCIRTESAISGLVDVIETLMYLIPSIKCGYGPPLLNNENDLLKDVLGKERKGSRKLHFEGQESYTLLWAIGSRIKELVVRDMTYRLCDQLIVLSHSPLLRILSLAFKNDDPELTHRVSGPGDWWMLDLETEEYTFPVRS